MICTNPIHKKRNDGTTYSVPCGRCYGCINRWEGDWKTRIAKEIEYQEHKPLFITLTYNNENLIKIDNKLSITDTQKFFKRLRKRLEKTDYKIKYIITGEYGKFNTQRAHYHGIIFGLPMHNKITKLNARQEIELAWGNGYVDVQELKGNGSYVLKYIVKNKIELLLNKNKKTKHNEIFIYSSKQPAIGKLNSKDIEKLKDKIHSIGSANELTIKKNGYNTAIPKYWLKKIDTETQELYKEIAKYYAEKDYWNFQENSEKLKNDYYKLQNKYYKFIKIK